MNNDFQMKLNVKKSKKDLVHIEPFKEYLTRMQQEPKKEPSYVYPNLINYNTSFDLVKTKLLDLQSIRDDELKYIIDSNFSNILKDIFETNKGTSKLLSLFSDSRFLNMFTVSLYNIEPTYPEYVYCNKAVYDYIILDASEKNKTIESLLFNMANVLNRKYIHSLTILGIDEFLALNMLIATHSSLNEFVSVKRLNCIITAQSPELMTEEMIVKIYNVLFQRITPLFEGVMLDVWNDSELDDQDKRDVHSYINLAILNTVNSLELPMIRQLLINYYQDKNYKYPNNPVRFNINCFSQEDYPRLRVVLDELEQREGYRF